MCRQAVELLSRLIAVPSLSREEEKTADIIESFLKEQGCDTHRRANNVWVCSMIDDSLPVILLNSHHDTVKPVSSWTRDPFLPEIVDGRLYGLGSNDAGASLVCLMMAYLHFEKQEKRNYNLIYAATAEEEVSGKNGIVCILDDLGSVDFAVVGEPTQMQMAVAEKGLMVLDCETAGKTGHAARDEGINAVYLAMEDMEWFRSFQFPKVSGLSGSVKMTVTVIHSGYQHNIVPDKCTYTVDVRTNEYYTNEQVLDIIRSYMKYSVVTPRSTHLNSSSIPVAHPFVQKGLSLGLTTFGSPTTSDQSRIPYTSVKIGPGNSARSHTADEYIYVDEIKQGMELYVQLLNGFRIT
jgi:acetylornithine deacetylase